MGLSQTHADMPCLRSPELLWAWRVSLFHPASWMPSILPGLDEGQATQTAPIRVPCHAGGAQRPCCITSQPPLPWSFPPVLPSQRESPECSI